MKKFILFLPALFFTTACVTAGHMNRLSLGMVWVLPWLEIEMSQGYWQ